MRFSDDQTSSESNRDYEVGYGRPPKHTQFQPGYSGNPRGKPAGAFHPATILKRTLLEKIPVKKNGREIKITKLEAFVEQIINDAMNPDYVPVLFLFRHAGLGRKLEERIREREKGMSHETANQIRALLGGDCETADCETDSPSTGEPSGEPSSPPGHARDQLQIKENVEGQVQPVGYGNPPIYSQFRKGQSGNPAGRPRISKDFTAITRRMLLERVAITENGRRQTLSKQEVILKQIVNKALKGNNRFRALLLEYVPAMDLLLRRRPVPRRVLVERIKRSLGSWFSDD
jgi:hypothetical protein